MRVHSTGQVTFFELMIKARKRDGMSYHELAERLHKPQFSSPKFSARRIDIMDFATICRAKGMDPIKLMKALMRLLSANAWGSNAPAVKTA